MASSGSLLLAGPLAVALDGDEAVAAVVSSGNGASSSSTSLSESRTRLISRKLDRTQTVALAKALRTNGVLKTLQLAFVYIGDDGATAIADSLKVNNVLTELDLGWNGVAVTGAKALADGLRVNTGLKTLKLQNNQIGVEGATAIAESLKVNRMLAMLYLGDCQIGGAAAKAIADSLQVNNAVAVLDLSGNEIGDEGATAIGGSLETNNALTVLNLFSNRISGFGVLAIAASLKTNRMLNKLEISRNDIGDDGAEAFAECLSANTALATLDVAQNNIGDSGARAFASSLKVNTALKTLLIGRNNIGDDGAAAIANGLKGNVALTTLHVDMNRFGVDGAKPFAECLKVNTVLTTLDVDQNDIGDQGAKAMANGLKANRALTRLNVESNRIGVDGAIAIADSLKVNAVIKTLHLSGNAVGDEGAKAIGENLKSNSILTTLDVTGNKLSPAGRDALASGLVVQYQTLKALVVSDVSVDGEDEPLSATGVLAQIPITVLQEGMKGLVKYLANLVSAGNRRRVKLMVVGYGAAGKTTLLDVLQPVRVHVTTHGLIMHKARVVEIEGTTLRITKNDATLRHELQLSTAWQMVVEQRRVTLTPPKGSAEKAVNIDLPEQRESDELIARLGHAIYNAATHGIEVRRMTVPNSEQKAVEVVAWDFAGQQEYYNSHHHFLSDQALYVVVWDVTKQTNDDAGNALLFWLRSLRVQLPPPSTSSFARSAVVVVGTHIDKLDAAARTPPGRQLRDEFVRATAKKAGLTWDLTVLEVSLRAPLVAVAELRERLFALAGQLAGDGQLVATATIEVEEHIEALTAERQKDGQLPMARLVDVTSRSRFTEAQVVSALMQMASWGRIVYQRDFSDLIVLSPTFLTKEAMGDLFGPAQQFMKGGHLKKSNLVHVWSSNTAVVTVRDDIMRLMERFDVCYENGDELVFPALLPRDEPAAFAELWPGTPSDNQVDLVRIFALDVLPSHLVPRTLSRLHGQLHLQLVWRGGAVLRANETTLGLLRLVTSADRLSGRLVVRVRPFKSDRLSGMRLLAHIVAVVKDCVSLYPGVIMEELVECTTGQCGDCVMSVTTVAAAIERDHMLCAHNRGVSARRLLEHAGLIDVAPDATPTASLAYSTDLLSLMVRLNTLESTLHTSLKHSDECNYPCLFVLVPAEPARDWLGKWKERAMRMVFDKFRLLPMCEFSLGAEALCHPPANVPGVEIADLKNREVVERFGTALKITTFMLQAVQIGIHVAGIPFPDIASALGGLVEAVTDAAGTSLVLQLGVRHIKNTASSSNVTMSRQHQQPQRLTGKALSDVETRFGRNLNGLVEAAALHRTSVTRDGCPSGSAGSCSWVCAQHREVIHAWNDGQIDAASFRGARPRHHRVAVDDLWHQLIGFTCLGSDFCSCLIQWSQRKQSTRAPQPAAILVKRSAQKTTTFHSKHGVKVHVLQQRGARAPDLHRAQRQGVPRRLLGQVACNGAKATVVRTEAVAERSEDVEKLKAQQEKEFEDAPKIIGSITVGDGRGFVIDPVTRQKKTPGNVPKIGK